MNSSFIITIAGNEHKKYADIICQQIETSAKERGTGIAKRTPEYICQKMEEGKAIIAVTLEGVWAGFSYIEAWSEGKFVANSGLIVAPTFRKDGLAKEIKKKIFRLSREMYPDAKIFSLTTGPAVMKINSDMGYRPVTYSQITDDENFWKGCQSCVNYQILISKERKNCLCTALLYDAAQHEQPKNNMPENKTISVEKSYTSIYESMKRAVQLFFSKQQLFFK
jgi:hypothetical protein